MQLSAGTLAELAAPFRGGNGPSHSAIYGIWMAADALEYLPSEEEANKHQRVMTGLRGLQRGAGSLPADEEKLAEVVVDLSAELAAGDWLSQEAIDEMLARDGFALAGGSLKPDKPSEGPADRLVDYVEGLFRDRDELSVARNHYEQGNRAYDQGDWEAANAQFRTACESTFDALASAAGYSGRGGGAARKWLQANGELEKDEAELVQTFMNYAGRAGSHPGVSSAIDAGLRRHMATALIVFAVAKLS